MASLFGTAIIAMCASTPGAYNQACTHALDAGTRQVGIRQQADLTESQGIHYATTTYENNTSKPTQEVFGASALIYKTVKSRKLTIKLPTLGLCSSISNEIELNRYAVTFRWEW